MGGYGVIIFLSNLSDDRVCKVIIFLRWRKQEYNKLELQVTSAQFKGCHVVYLK